MHDIKFIRDNPDLFDERLAARGLPPQAPEILELDTCRRAAQTELQNLQTARNEKSAQVGALKKSGGDATALTDEVAAIKNQMTDLADSETALADKLKTYLETLPNLPAADVPQGTDENDNRELRTFGAPAEMPAAQDHTDLGAALGLMDFETAAKIAGTRFVILKGQLARLERALGQFMLDTHVREFGYTECSVPILVNATAMYGTGNLPKFDNMFKTTDERYLIATSEISLTNFVNDMIVPQEQLPLRLTALTPCFRSEAGAAGRDTKGMLRQHQFYKVELVSITRPEDSDAEHERMTDAAETILKKLEIPFRTMLLCTGDMGFASRKTYDIEAWLPGQQKYREISSCSNCGDFQGRRMNARFRRDGAKGTEFVHTLNGSGVAVGRALIAVMENYQQSDGSIVIPEVLRPYMGGLDVISV